MGVDQLRLRLYREGQIVLPVSRYGIITGKKDKHIRCDAKRENQQQQLGLPCSPANDIYASHLLADLPAGASGDDAVASQREVKEAEARVIWEPEGWTAGWEAAQEGGPSSRGPLQSFASAIKMHLPGLAPAPAVPLSHLERQPAAEQPSPPPDAEGKPGATGEAAVTGSTGAPSDAQHTAAGVLQTAETPTTEQQQEKGGGEEGREDGNSRQAEGEQQQQAAERMQRSPSGESARQTEEGETSDARQREGSHNADGKEAYLGSLLRMLLKRPSAKESNLEKNENAGAEVSGEEEEENEKVNEKGITTSQQFVPDQEELEDEPDDGREKEKMPSLQPSPNERMHAAPASSEESRIRLEVEVIKVEAASSHTEDLAEEQKQQPWGKGQAEQENESVEAEASNTAAAASDALSADVQTDQAPLAPAALTLAANPYFDPDVVKDEEFFGLREGDVLLSIGNYSESHPRGASLLNLMDEQMPDEESLSSSCFCLDCISLSISPSLPLFDHRDLERVAFTYVVTHFFNGQTTFAYVLREGRILKVTEKEGDQFVVLSLILASDVSVGYEQPPCVVESVNGEEVRNMRDLVRLIESTTGEFVKLRLVLAGSNHLLVVIDKQKAQAIHEKVLREHNIVRDRSPDLL
ncbi:hypothetical protein Emag_003549 [Eimeria magna]